PVAANRQDERAAGNVSSVDPKITTGEERVVYFPPSATKGLQAIARPETRSQRPVGRQLPPIEMELHPRGGCELGMNKPILRVELEVFWFENGMVIRPRRRYHPVLHQVVGNADMAGILHIL